MLSTAQSIAAVVTVVAFVVATLLLVYRIRGQRSSPMPSDGVAWHVSLVGTTYAVITAFMLSGVWANFQAAETNAAQEAIALVNLFRVADGIPSPQREQIQTDCRDYANIAVAEEWPAMAHDSLSPAGVRITQQLWTTLLRTEAHSPTEQISLAQSLESLGRMTEHRRIRQLQSRSRLPTILWAILLAGGIATIGASCTFESRSLRLHALQVATLAVLISLVLAAIADIDRPFQGAVHVSADGFRFARATFDGVMSVPR
ncbi:hypothetical protein tb265_21210 [Gemmatimonadetes bacterium T265]|nr:hypothetical protein tb265_21210 [Gemmatimonadetes bacterium T265]